MCAMFKINMCTQNTQIYADTSPSRAQIPKVDAKTLNMHGKMPALRRWAREELVSKISQFK